MIELSNDLLDNLNYQQFRNNDSTVNIVLNFIDFVKAVERARGLTDEQIVAKYTHGGCSMLSNSIKQLVDNYGNNDNIKAQIYEMDVVPTSWAPTGTSYHSYVELYEIKESINKNTRIGKIPIPFGIKKESYGYFDILGYHNYQELSYYKCQFWIDNRSYESVAENMQKQEFDYDVPLLVLDYFLNNILLSSKNTKTK